MSFQLRSPAEVLAGRIPEILQRAADLQVACVNGKPPTTKSAATTACLEAYQNALRDQLAGDIAGWVNFHEMVYGELSDASDQNAWREDFDNAFADRYTAIRTELGDQFDVVSSNVVLGVGGADEVAQFYAESLTKLLKPAGPHMGKFLSAIGIAEPHLKQIDEIAAHQTKLYGAAAIAADTPPPPATTVAIAHVPPPPGVPAPPPPPAPPGLASLIPPPPGVPYQQPAFAPPVPPLPAAQALPAAPPAPASAPDAAAVKRALALWYNDSGPDLEEFARALGMSVSTLRNRCTGRSEGKLTASQAAILKTDCDRAIVSLTEAGNTFAAIR